MTKILVMISKKPLNTIEMKNENFWLFWLLKPLAIFAIKSSIVDFRLGSKNASENGQKYYK